MIIQRIKKDEITSLHLCFLYNTSALVVEARDLRVLLIENREHRVKFLKPATSVFVLFLFGGHGMPLEIREIGALTVYLSTESLTEPLCILASKTIT